MTPTLVRISQLTDENAQLRAALARVADLEAAASLQWITEEELRQSRARVAELEAALRETLDAPDSTISGALYHRMEQIIARAESATPAKHPNMEGSK